MEKAGIYVHIPFCKSKCPYCDFYSVRLKDFSADAYTDYVIKKIKSDKEKYDIMADTLYIGGGTPSLMGGDNIAKIVNTAKIFGDFQEITVECNPSCIEKDFFEKISYCGVNRISLGLQSANNDERRSLGRTAGITEIKKCIADCFSAGINNISLDVMLGIPNQTKSSLRDTLNFCTDSGAAHISAYILKLEEDTYFYKNQNRLNLPDDDYTADLYLDMTDILNSKGFLQYEISNFAKNGYESKHNLKYWKCREYLGIGPAAHSFIKGKRFYYPRSIEHFMSGGDTVDDGPGGDVYEYVMLGLRLNQGVSYSEIIKRCPDAHIEKIKENVIQLVNNNFAVLTDDGFHLTAEGFLISNTIIENIAEKI